MLATMRPLPAPFDAIAAGRPAAIAVAGSALLGSRLLTKDLAFSEAERDAFHLRGLLPDRVLTIDQQVVLELEHLRRKDDPLERYIGLAALQDRNATLFYRLLAEHLAEFLPIVYTPTVGRACEEFSHIVRRTRGTWITPKDRDRIPQLLREGPYDDVRLIVVTDNERILGLGDQGAGGMAIPIGKLALYTAASGIHPALTLPVSLDVGTDNPALLADPLYVGHREPRLRGPAYDELIEAFVAGVSEVWPDCVIQWEDFKQANALGILDRYRGRVPSFNDDVQGTAAVVLGGVLAALRGLRTTLAETRVVLVGAGAAGIGIARLLRLAMLADGMSEADARRALVLVDSRGQVHDRREDLDATKRELALPTEAFAGYGFTHRVPGARRDRRTRAPDRPHRHDRDRRHVHGGRRPGGRGRHRRDRWSCRSPTRRRRARRHRSTWCAGPTAGRSSPPGRPSTTSRWTAGRSRSVRRTTCSSSRVSASGPSPPRRRTITDRMFLVAARTLAAAVTDERLASGGIYPPVDDLRAVTRRIAIAVAQEAIEAGVARVGPDETADALVDAAMWWPAYVPYEPARPTERRRAGET